MLYRLSYKLADYTMPQDRNLVVKLRLPRAAHRASADPSPSPSPSPRPSPNPATTLTLPHHYVVDLAGNLVPPDRDPAPPEADELQPYEAAAKPIRYKDKYT